MNMMNEAMNDGRSHQTLSLNHKMKKNIFALCQESFGYNCFVRKDHAAKVRNTLYRHIRGSCNYSHVVKDIVKDGLNFFAETTESTMGKLDLVGSNRFENAVEVLYISSHLCQKYDIKDSELVQLILRAVFNATKTFDPWYEFLDQLSFVFEIETNLYPFPYNDEAGHITKERLGALEYFLSHAANLKVSNVCFQNLSFGTGTMEMRPLLVKQDTTFVDAPLQNCRGCTPLLLACHSSSPDAVHLLLRYGACPLAAAAQVQNPLAFNIRFHQPLYVLVSKLNALMFWKTHGFHEQQSSEEINKIQEDMKKREKKLIDCLEIFRQSMPMFPVFVSQDITKSPLNSENQYIHPNFAHLASKGPGNLRHLARCEVRKCIKECGSLPSDLDTLPLPVLLKEYLDIRF